MCWWEWSKGDEEEQPEDYGVETDFAKVLNPSDGVSIDVSNPLCPKFCFEEKEKERLLKPFGRTLVVKLLGRQPSYSFMIKKLRQLWERKGSIDIFDLQNEFYLVNFQQVEDYMEALTGGPWVINDAYLNVARWKPDFNPQNARIETVVAWVRFPNLPAPLFDKKFLLNLGNVIGKAIKLDIHTAQRARGKFARMCVELDLTKPLVPEFEVEGQTLSVVYESLGMLCTKCGMFVHVKERCEDLQQKKSEMRMDVETVGDKKKGIEGSKVKKDRWQTVQRFRRQRNFNMPPQAYQRGSRFSILEEESGGEGVQSVKANTEMQQVSEAGHGRAQEEVVIKDNKKQRKQGNLSENKKNTKVSKVKNLEPSAQRGKIMVESQLRTASSQGKMKVDRGPLREVQQNQATMECVSKTNFEVNRSRDVGSREKENLHPGELATG
ncbi:hypothetical protein K1719_016792 [Acacia pycnantha]|nr:hypothetical protein K1719_016792 [Acacia pycnantha]